MKRKLGDRIISLILSFNLVFNNLTPFVSLATVRAQDVTPEPTAEATVSPTVDPTPTLEVSPTESVSPTVEPTQDVTPTETVDVTPTVYVTPVEETTPTEEPTLAPEEAPSVPSPPSDNNGSSGGSSAYPTPEMSVEPSPSPSPTPEVFQSSALIGTVETQVVESYSCRADSLNGCLITDKADYAPTDVAVITGYGFAPNTSYTLRVYSTDEPATDNSYQITTDSNGSFTYSYQLDGNYRPNYTVELKDNGGFVVATVTFTDEKPENPPNPAADLDQCKNETATSPQSPCQWVNGSLNSNQAHYVEGLSVPYRLRMTNLTNGAHSVILGYDVKHSGAHAIDFLTHYNRFEPHSPFGHTAETIDPTSGVMGLGSPLAFPIPAPSSAGSPVSGQPTTLFNSLPSGEKLMTIYNGTITGISYPTQGNLTDAQSETTIQIDFTSTNPTVVLAWGGHIATEQTWGSGNSAGGISGAPYHMRLKDLDGSGGNQDRSLQAGAVAPPSSITVIKDAQPDNAQDFAFTTTGNGLSNFSLDDDADGTLSNTVTFNSLLAGPFTVVETLIPGWTLTSKTCQSDGTGSTSSQITNGVSITLVAGENVTCTFTNTQVTGSITIVKNAIPDDAQDFSFTGDLGAFSLDDDADGTLQNSETFSSLVGGTYVVTEGSLSNWDLTNLVCNDADLGTTVDLATRTATIDLDYGQNLTCTFTNTKKGSISGHKYNDTNGNGQLDAQEPGLNTWTIFIDENDNQTLDGGETSTTTNSNGAYSFSNLVPGEYTVCEVLQTDWVKTYPTICHVVTINAGQDSGTNNFLNFQCATISGMKWEDLNGDGVKDAEEPGLPNWTINKSGPENGSTTTDGDGKYSFKVCKGGSYTISETNPDSNVWYQTFPGGASPNHSVEVTSGGTYSGKDFGNTRYAKIFGYKYRDNDGDGVLDANDLLDTLGGWVIDLYSGTTNTIIDTTTTISGGLLNGYYEFTRLLVNQTYYVLEQLLSGWNQTYGPTSSPTPTPFSVTSGENKRIDFANFQDATIIVHKNVVKPDGTTEVVDTTEFTALLNNLDPKTIAEGTNATYSELTPGIYTITEQNPLPTGYALVSITDDDASTPEGQVSVTSGNTNNVYITNRQLTANLTLVKHLPNDDGGTAVEGNFNVYIDGVQTTWGSHDVDPDSYVVSEDALAGYTPSIWSNDCDAQGNVTLLPGQSKTCEITNDDIAPTLKLVKSVTNNNGGTKVANDWTLYAAALDPNDRNFSNLGGSGSFKTIYANTGYVLSESSVSGYSPSSWNCTGGGSLTGDTVTLGLNEEVTCTITNDDQTGRLVVVKVLINDDGGNATKDDFSYKVNGGSSVFFEADGQNESSVNSDYYTIVEDPETGYATTYDNCTEVFVPNGGSATCTITNNDIPPTLKLVKSVITDNGGTAVANDWTLYAAADTPNNGRNFNNLGGSGNFQTVYANVPYVLTESVVAGYSASAWNCIGAGLQGNLVTLNLGAQATCTITNDDIGPTLTLVKKVNGGSSEPADWLLTATGPTGFSGPGPTASNGASFDAGTYDLSESGPVGYSASDWVCVGGSQTDGDTIVVGLDDDVTCTITNTRDTGNIVLTKLIDADGSNSTTGDRVPYEGWVMDIDPDGQDTDDPSLSPTDSSGNTGVNGIKTGNYWVSEDPNGPTNNYHFLTSYCTLDGNPTGNSGTNSFGSVAVAKNKTTYCTFVNVRDTGDLIVHKEVQSTVDRKFISVDPGDFKWGLSEGDTPYEMGSTQTLETGNYDVYENEVFDYHFVGWYFTDSEASCEDEELETKLPANVTVSSGTTTEITFCNARDTGEITVYKNIDGNNDGDLEDLNDQTHVSGWTWDITGG